MVYTYSRGHRIEWEEGEWVYADTREPVEGSDRGCVRCGRLPTNEGYDACLGYLQGVRSACCGHGIIDPIRR